MEDKLLMWKLRRGDSKALQRIYEKYKNTLLALALHLCHDRDMAEDILHDIFVSFSRKAPGLYIKTSLKSYLAASIVNRVRNLARSPAEKAEPLEHRDFRNENLPGPQQLVELEEDVRLLDDAIHRLPTTQREVLLLHLGQGLTFKVIAQSLDESINTIQSRYRYGLQKLRSILNNEVQHDQN
jgi:RNA polymerase sigma-70 factor (ECF subfamily)